jgi:phage shock protein A
MGLNDLNQHAINSRASLKLAEQKYNEAVAEVAKWHKCAKIAMKKGREDLAREALIRKHEYSKTATSLKTQLEQLGGKIDNPNGNSLNQTSEKRDSEDILNKSILNAQDAVKMAVASFESLQQQYGQSKKEAHFCQQQALDALQKDDDNLAVQAIISKTVQSKIATSLKTQMDRQLAVLEALKQNLMALENIKEMLKAQTATYVNSKDRNAPVTQAEVSSPSPSQTSASKSEEAIDVDWEALGSQIDQL